MYTELSGDVAKKLIAQYIAEGQVKFPPGSRRFRREDRRIGKEGRYGKLRLHSCEFSELTRLTLILSTLKG